DNLPPELLLFWKPEDLEYIHDLSWWRRLLEQSKDAELLSIKETEGNEELWQDWIRQDNEYAAGDRKVIEAGGGKYLNFIAFVLRKK
ncbi:MAG: SAM-dependent methyltransferase, partial [Clostridia bacterium]